MEYTDDDRVLYKGSNAVEPFDGLVSEMGTMDPLYPSTIEWALNRDVYIAVDNPAQDARDMTKEEKAESMQIAIDSSEDTKWLVTYCTNKSVSGAHTKMMATKINWYQTNHYVGQEATHFIHKIVSTVYPWMGASKTTIINMAKSRVWEIGHWISTHLALNVMGMRTGIGVCANNCGLPVKTTKLADDMKIHRDAAPAGMAKAALVHATMQIHHKNIMWLGAPGCEKIRECVNAYQDFLDEVAVCRRDFKVNPRCKNHEGRAAFFTTAAPRAH